MSRITKSGAKNLQDWDTKDHAAAGHAQVADPFTLARANITISIGPLEVAAAALGRIGDVLSQADVLMAIQQLENALEAMTCAAAREAVQP